MPAQSPDELLLALSTALGLAWEPQDWGLVNADPGRVDEFISFYELKPDLAPTQRYELAGLILASINEALSSRELTAESLARALRFVDDHRTELSTHLAYWEKLPEEEFPLAGHLRTK